MQDRIINVAKIAPLVRTMTATAMACWKISVCQNSILVTILSSFSKIFTGLKVGLVVASGDWDEVVLLGVTVVQCTDKVVGDKVVGFDEVCVTKIVVVGSISS